VQEARRKYLNQITSSKKSAPSFSFFSG